MLEEAHALPDDVAALKAMVLASRAELRNRDLLIEKLKHQLAGLCRQRFGTTSEALDQLKLGLEDEEIARAAEVLPEPPPGAKRAAKAPPPAGSSAARGDGSRAGRSIAPPVAAVSSGLARM